MIRFAGKSGGLSLADIFSGLKLLISSSRLGIRIVLK
jgi:hypothetical protein